jgi:tetratricopeptide (TPR) repeat protein
VPPAVRRVLDVAAVIGREVPVGLLGRVAEIADAALADALGHLRRAEFVYERGEDGAEPGLVFRHQLVHEVAYERVAASERHAIHGRVLAVLEAAPAERLSERIESLAHHALHAGERERAVGYLLQAGRKAAGRSALPEAVGYLRHGLDVLGALPATAERDRQELELHVWLGISEASRRGFAAPEVGRIHRHARELCRRVEAGPLLLGALGGLWQFYYFGGDFAAARDLAEQHRKAVLASGATNRLCASHDALGYTALHVGELAPARDHLREAVALYDTHPRPPGTSLTPLDLGVAAAGGLAMVTCLLGETDEPLAHVADALARASRLLGSEALSLAYAHTCASRTFLLRREPERAAEHAGAAIAIGERHGYVAPVIAGELDLSMARIVLGDVRGGIELLTAGLARWRAAGFELDRPYWLAGLADGHRRLGDLGAATAAVDEGLEHLARCGERVWAPELYAVRAGIERASASAVVPARARERAVADLERSIEIARAQGAGLFERRAREVLEHMGEDT